MDRLLFHILFPPFDGLTDREMNPRKKRAGWDHGLTIHDPTLPLWGHRKGPGHPKEERQENPSAWDWLA